MTYVCLLLFIFDKDIDFTMIHPRMQFNLSNPDPIDALHFFLHKYVEYALGYYIMGKLQSMLGNTFFTALLRPLSLSDIKNVIELANPAF